jgi:Rab GDP dissociation inhibitor
MERLTFDKEYYPYIVLGTGPVESILTASLATHKKNSANFDAQKFYSGPMKTLSMKELETLYNSTLSPKDEDPLKSKQVGLKASGFAFDFNPNASVSNFEQLIAEFGFRGWNIDYQPRMIFSEAPATDRLIEAQIDHYVSFRTIKAIYFFIAKKKKFTKVPTDKGGIFQEKNLSLLEKKSLFQFMNLAMRYCTEKAGHEKDMNSLSDFEKDVYQESVTYLQSLKFNDEGLLNSPFLEFLKQAGVKSDLVVQLVTYCLCNYYTSPYAGSENCKEIMTTREFLGRIYRFLKSLGCHGETPYLYPIYGIGDTTQVLSRISAVHNSIFVLEPKIEVTKVEVGSWDLNKLSRNDAYVLKQAELDLAKEKLALEKEAQEANDEPEPQPNTENLTDSKDLP